MSAAKLQEPVQCHVMVLSRRRLLAESMAYLISMMSGYQAEAVDASEVGPLPQMSAFPDLVLVAASDADDVRELAERARREWPETRLVILALDAGPWCNRVSAEVGAVGWVGGEATREALLGALRSAWRDGRVAPSASRHAVSRRPRDPDHLALSLLSNREKDVLQLLAGGAEPVMVAATLGISRNTVRTHVQNVMLKLGVHSRFEMLAVARRAGMFADSAGSDSPDLVGWVAPGPSK